ncbi:aminoglycoside 3'-phosphotransferase [Cellulomonas sp. PSBB021]|uniref:aminoglycoside 3'-phosphotransferase n=1 Tax=Cellulomonas sp. PSBB021 TaxID=2003551 RepID=UPI000B8D6ACF|nr:aminoglycoside 3'-phosphotransferase [Cellulomonas sp. PSBB021]ASR55163.1 aminoglycoside phosphotransferase APH(3') [Cellulomonas sp. PSBB021]
MSIPTGPVVVPEAVHRLVGDAPFVADPPVHAVWQNLDGGTTFHSPVHGVFVKWAPAGTPFDLAAEAERLVWAGRFSPVPEVVTQGADDEGAWLVTRAVPGRSAVDPLWLARPLDAVRAVGAGLRALHDALPVVGCPFSWSVEDRLGRLDDRDRAAALAEAPPVDRLVVCHGDACVPNTLLSDDGAWLAHVDLGRLGVADRWADLAIATWSTVWNYGPGYEDALLDAYGVAPDLERTAYYRALWGSPRVSAW